MYAASNKSHSLHTCKKELVNIFTEFLVVSDSTVCGQIAGSGVVRAEQGNATAMAEVLHCHAVRTSTFLAATLASIALDAGAAGVVASAEIVVGNWPGLYGAAPPPAYDRSGRCPAALNCADYEQWRRFIERYERNYGNRFAPDPPAREPPAQRRDVPPTPAANIQPAYRDTSQLRPQFEQAGGAPHQGSPRAR